MKIGFVAHRNLGMMVYGVVAWATILLVARRTVRSELIKPYTELER